MKPTIGQSTQQESHNNFVHLQRDRLSLDRAIGTGSRRRRLFKQNSADSVVLPAQTGLSASLQHRHSAKLKDNQYWV